MPELKPIPITPKAKPTKRKAEEVGEIVNKLTEVSGILTKLDAKIEYIYNHLGRTRGLQLRRNREVHAGQVAATPHTGAGGPNERREQVDLRRAKELAAQASGAWNGMVGGHEGVPDGRRGEGSTATTHEHGTAMGHLPAHRRELPGPRIHPMGGADMHGVRWIRLGEDGRAVQ